jgi:hypothetical protein
MSKPSLIYGVICFGGFALSLLDVAAQTDVPPLPTAPFLASPPAPSSWTILYTYTDTPAPSNPDPIREKEIQVTKTADSIREVTTWSDGSQTERWQVGKYIIFTQLGFPAGYAAVHPSGDWYPSGDFPFLSRYGIGLHFYKGAQSYEGQSCYFYQIDKDREANRIPGLPGNPNPLKIWISVKTSLPVAFDDGRSIQSYAFTLGGEKDQTMPPVYAQALAKTVARDSKPLVPLPKIP